MDRGLWHCTGDRNQDHPQEKEQQKCKMAVWGGLTNKLWKEVKSKAEKERYSLVPKSNFYQCYWSIYMLLYLFLTFNLIHFSSFSKPCCIGPPVESPRDGGAWWAAIYGVSQSWAWQRNLAAAAAFFQKHINSSISSSSTQLENVNNKLNTLAL